MSGRVCSILCTIYDLYGVSDPVPASEVQDSTGTHIEKEMSLTHREKEMTKTHIEKGNKTDTQSKK